MKKLLALILAALLGASLAICLTSCDDEEKTDNGTSSDEIVGGWSSPDSVKVTDEAASALKKATEKLAGGTYEPIALLGTQVVAGTNHAILCKASEINKGSSWVIIYLYEDLQGDVSIMNIADFEFGSLCTYGSD